MQELNSSERLGHATLDLLALEWMFPLLERLAGGAGFRPCEIERSLAGVAHSQLMHRLEELERRGVVRHERYGGMPPRAHYALTAAGRDLLAVPRAAATWERRWFSRPVLARAPGLTAVRVVSDAHNRELIAGLAHEGPLCAAELERRVSGLGRSATRRRLTELSRQGILAREISEGTMVYELTDGARRLGLPMMLAARWEWRHARPERHLPATDLAGLVRLLAPIVRLPAWLGGVCALHVDSRSSLEPEIRLAVLDGRVLVLPVHLELTPCVTGRGTPEAWCESLLEGRLQGLAVDGESRILEVVMARLSAALHS